MDKSTAEDLIAVQIESIKEQKEAYMRNSLAELNRLKTVSKADEAVIEAQKRYIEHLQSRGAYEAKVLEYTKIQKDQFGRIADALEKLASKYGE